MIHWCDGPNPERESAVAGRLGSQRLLRHGDGMARLNWDHGGTDLDALGHSAQKRNYGHGVEVAGNLRNPEGGEARIFGASAIGEQSSQAFSTRALLVGADHQTYSH